jgi:hypothetical protein
MNHGISRHHGKVVKDKDNNIWSGHCDCSLIWDNHHWETVIYNVVTHVAAARKTEKLGVGFTR